MQNAIEIIFQLLLFAWFGTVVGLNVVFIPQMAKLTLEQRAQFIANFFPRLFRTVTIAGAIILAVGAIHFFFLNTFDSKMQKIGLGVLVGLYLFHVIVEKGLRPIALGFQQGYTDEEVNRFYRYLRFVPRVGLAAITIATTLIIL